jgi:hypothetical protein
MGTMHFQKIELEDIAYYLNTGKKRKRARYLRNENLLIGSEGTESFGNAVV